MAQHALDHAGSTLHRVGGAHNPAAGGNSGVCSYSHFNKALEALPGSTVESGQWEECTLPATHGDYCSKHAAYANRMQSAEHKRHLRSFYSSKMLQIVDQTVRTQSTVENKATGKKTKRWNPNKEKWVMLADIPSDCYYDFQIDSRYDQDEYV